MRTRIPSHNKWRSTRKLRTASPNLRQTFQPPLRGTPPACVSIPTAQYLNIKNRGSRKEESFFALSQRGEGSFTTTLHRRELTRVCIATDLMSMKLLGLFYTYQTPPSSSFCGRNPATFRAFCVLSADLHSVQNRSVGRLFSSTSNSLSIWRSAFMV